MRKLLFSLLCGLAAMLAMATTATAQPREAPSAAADPALEKRVLALSEDLRCLVCQNQTLADSHAELAIDLKNQVREKLASGMSDKQVVDYMVERYGDFVLYRPPVKSVTWLLWFGPFLLLFGGLGVLASMLRKRRTSSAAQDVSPHADMRRAAALLNGATETREKS
jgi:cytochrome c-type biogenesis protein CcmH